MGKIFGSDSLNHWREPEPARDAIETVINERLLTWDVRPGEAIVIVGGFEGAETAFLLDRFPFAEIYTFEPQTPFYQHLVRRFVDCPNVHLFNYGLGITDGTFSMTRAGSYFCSFVLEEAAQLGYSSADSVGELREFDSVMRELGLEELALLHSNCEQYEYLLLPHMIRIGWPSKIRQLIIATHTPLPEEYPNAERWEKIQVDLEVTHKLLWNWLPWWGLVRLDTEIPYIPLPEGVAVG